MAGRTKAPFPRLRSEDALAALRWLHATGEVTAKQIVGALRNRDELVEEIRRRLQELGAQGARFLASVPARRRPPAPRPRRRKGSARAVAAWKAQGRYMAAVRRLPKADRAKVRAIREKRGGRAAIATARRLAEKL